MSMEKEKTEMGDPGAGVFRYRISDIPAGEREGDRRLLQPFPVCLYKDGTGTLYICESLRQSGHD